MYGQYYDRDLSYVYDKFVQIIHYKIHDIHKPIPKSFEH